MPLPEFTPEMAITSIERSITSIEVVLGREVPSFLHEITLMCGKMNHPSHPSFHYRYRWILETGGLDNVGAIRPECLSFFSISFFLTISSSHA